MHAKCKYGVAQIVEDFRHARKKLLQEHQCYLSCGQVLFLGMTIVLGRLWRMTQRDVLVFRYVAFINFTSVDS